MKVIKLQAMWCNPCKTLSRNLEGFNLCELDVVDIDENQEAMHEYGVRNIPALIIEKDGQILEKIIGIISKEELENKVNGFKQG